MPNTIDIITAEPVGTINPNIYGHFAEHLGTCIYDGLWVGEESATPNTGGISNDVIKLLKKVRPPVLRWPGGCYADDYDWHNGVGPRAERPRTINIHWGNVIDTNAFGTHEFIEVCRALGAEPYFAGNLGSGTPQQMRDWIEYCNFPGGTTLTDMRAANGSPEPLRVGYWGVGNENWGCGGNFTPEDYATEYRRFSTFLRDFGDTPVSLIACGPNNNNLDWTRRFFTKLKDVSHRAVRIHGYAAHYYCRTPGTALEYDQNGWYQLLTQAAEMEPLVVQQRALMDAFDPERRIGLIVDEWGTWHQPTPGRPPRGLWQQNTLRDALVAAITLDIFNRHADKVVMANIAQTVNVLQALVLTENGAAIATPTLHVYDMYQVHQGATALRTHVAADSFGFMWGGQQRAIPGLSGSASLRDGTLTLTVVNAGLGAPAEATIRLHGDATVAGARETVLTHDDMHAHNTFDNPDVVHLSDTRDVALSGRSLTHTFAPQSITRLELALR